MTDAVVSIKQDTETKMKKSLDALANEFAKLRTGRAHPSILMGIMVSYYGQMTPLSQVASVTVEDSRTLVVTPYEKKVVSDVDKAIRDSGLGLNPAVAGMVIRVPLPPLTEERRKVLIKQMKHEAELARVVVRNLRRDANNTLKDLLKNKKLSEDEERKAQDNIQKMTDQYIAEIDKAAHAKEADLMHV
jgi:ribosome recycling factor